MPALDRRPPTGWLSSYVGNWDQRKIIFVSDRSLYEFTASGEQLAVQRAYEGAGIERDPEKACKGLLRWESLGVELQGLEGPYVGSPAERRASLLGIILDIIAKPRSSAQLAPGACVGKVHLPLPVKRTLLSMFDCLFEEAAQANRYGHLSKVAEQILLMTCCVTPHPVDGYPC